MGPVRFGERGEWAEPRVLQVQFQRVEGHDVMQFLDDSKQVIVSPSAAKSGELIYPYAAAI